ncbi:uncharacterized protein LOC106139010 [Amyelois transitella]|uniref:uncharacterized protein LOC106139010 n=1 Tax=Amyelois transitella TaxID=680683 RepID=UPI00067A81A5|nr:uncharacterized protein LOC106139010 [Amyelois transitella]
MPEEDVSDLRDVVDAINKLCETMKTSQYDDAETYEEEAVPSEPAQAFDIDEESVVPQYAASVADEPEEEAVYVYRTEATVVPQYTECHTDLISPQEISVRKVETYAEQISPEETSSQRVEATFQAMEAYRPERWSDSQISLPGQTEDVETVTSDTEPAAAQFEPISEMYYTASSEVSLLSDLDVPDRAHVDEETLPEKETKDDRKECVIAGHVAAMRERFESMTRANTPCPDLMRSMSPSLDVFRNITPSPDHLG